MKFRYPKKITIGSQQFKLIYDKDNDSDAHVSYHGDNEHPYPHIFFGMKKGDMSFLEMVIHELKEVIQIEQDTRLVKRNDNSGIFYYTHTEHTDLCARLAGHLEKFIK
jgi:hypothetical protein